MQNRHPNWLDEQRASLHWLARDRSSEAVLARGFAILAVVTVVTAWFSETFFFPDEHYQILEYMSMKLGVTSPADLPWEFHARARPFLQPFLYFLIAKPLMAAGVRDLFTVVFVLRLITGAVSLIALWAFVKLMFGDLQSPDEKRAFARMLPFMGFLPYLFVRTSSETASAAFFTLGLVFAVEAARSGSWKRVAVAGLFCGMAFEFRYQTAFLSLGLLAWLVFVAKTKRPLLAAYVAGAIVPVLVALPIDRWGYGVWTFPAWTYLYVNLVQGVSSSVFGSSPFFAYLYLPLGTIFAPITAVLVVALVGTCLRQPKHYVTWATVPFVVVHSLLAHKEERFLFPLAILAVAYPVLAFAPGRPFPIFERLWSWRVPAKVIGWSAVAAMLFLAVYPFGIRPHMKMAKYLYRDFPNGLVAYSFDEPFQSYPMFRPPHFRAEHLASPAELEKLAGSGPVFLFSTSPAPPALPRDLRATLVYSEFPFYGSATVTGWAMDAMCGVADLKRTTQIHPPKLTWISLFKIERGTPNKSSVSLRPCAAD